MASIGTGRTARIALEAGTFSDTFELQKGHAQGDSPSPLLYNFAAQILLFKIELNVKVVPVFERQIGPVKYVPVDPFTHESNRETSTCECFADDNSTFPVLCYNSLLELKNNMEEFRKLSGLSCNVDKTFCMRIGDISGDIPAEILGLGFKFVEKVKILGFEVSNSQEWDKNNFDQVTSKIQKLTNFWNRFNLSLIGKITIYKTLLMPQINFYASIIMPSKETLNKLESIMNNFVTKGMTFAKSRLYIDAGEGGLGLFDLGPFIQALQSTWVKRALLACNDNWKFDLCETCNGNILMAGMSLEAQKNGPLLVNILVSFRHFHDCFAITGTNFKSMYILDNQMFGYGRGMTEKYDTNFFGNEIMRENSEVIKNLTWAQLTRTNGTFNILQSINHNLGLTLTQQQ